MVFSQTRLDIGYPQSQLQWEIVRIATAYLTQRKLNTQQIIAYPLERRSRNNSEEQTKKKIQSFRNAKNFKLQFFLCL